MKEYTITPKDLGIKKANLKSIRAISKERNIIDFLRIVYGKERGSKRDLVLVNTAAAFYVMDEVKKLAEGVKMAGEIIDEGLAADKLEFFVKKFGDKRGLGGWKKRAGINY